MYSTIKHPYTELVDRVTHHQIIRKKRVIQSSLPASFRIIEGFTITSTVQMQDSLNTLCILLSKWCSVFRYKAPFVSLRWISARDIHNSDSYIEKNRMTSKDTKSVVNVHSLLVNQTMERGHARVKMKKCALVIKFIIAESSSRFPANMVSQLSSALCSNLSFVTLLADSSNK